MKKKTIILSSREYYKKHLEFELKLKMLEFDQMREAEIKRLKEQNIPFVEGR